MPSRRTEPPVPSDDEDVPPPQPSTMDDVHTDPPQDTFEYSEVLPDNPDSTYDEGELRVTYFDKNICRFKFLWDIYFAGYFCSEHQ